MVASGAYAGLSTLSPLSEVPELCQQFGVEVVTDVDVPDGHGTTSLGPKSSKNGSKQLAVGLGLESYLFS